MINKDRKQEINKILIKKEDSVKRLRIIIIGFSVIIIAFSLIMSVIAGKEEDRITKMYGYVKSSGGTSKYLKNVTVKINGTKYRAETTCSGYYDFEYIPLEDMEIVYKKSGYKKYIMDLPYFTAYNEVYKGYLKLDNVYLDKK